MILIQTEEGAILRDPKAIYITADCSGKRRLVADLSEDGQSKEVLLVEGEYSEGLLVAMGYSLFSTMGGDYDAAPSHTRGGTMFIRMKDVIRKIVEGRK